MPNNLNNRLELVYLLKLYKFNTIRDTNYSRSKIVSSCSFLLLEISQRNASIRSRGRSSNNFLSCVSISSSKKLHSFLRISIILLYPDNFGIRKRKNGIWDTSPPILSNTLYRIISYHTFGYYFITTANCIFWLKSTALNLIGYIRNVQTGLFCSARSTTPLSYERTYILFITNSTSHFHFYAYVIIFLFFTKICQLWAPIYQSRHTLYV